MRASARRTYRFLDFARDLLALAGKLPALLRARRRRKVSKEFEKKLMLTVTAVNGCRYCSWFHARDALRCGLTADEIESLASGAIDRRVLPGEAPGLVYAQHFAESGRNPHAEATARLRATYGDEAAEEILLYLNVISVGNLSGNTFRSFLERVRDRRFLDRGFLSELLVFLAVLPLFGIIALRMRLRTDA
jgi:AhpD family alkylhydroperoxidase